MAAAAKLTDAENILMTGTEFDSPLVLLALDQRQDPSKMRLVYSSVSGNQTYLRWLSLVF